MVIDAHAVLDAATMVGELLGRAALVYGALLVALRLLGRREMSKVSPMDLLTMLLVARALGDALVGPYGTLGGGITAAISVLVVARITTEATFRWRPVDWVVNGRPVVLIEDGRIDETTLRRHRITHQALHTYLHRRGLRHPEDVARAYVEPDGTISIQSWTDLDDADAHRRTPPAG